MPEPLIHPDGLTARPSHPPPPGPPRPTSVTEAAARPVAAQPEDLNQLFTDRANAGDVDGLVALYEPDATIVFPPPGQPVSGTHAIRQAFTQVLADHPAIRTERRPTVHTVDLALTSVQWTMTLTGPDRQPRIISGVSVEVTRQQPDGTWLRIIDQPNVLGDVSPAPGQRLDAEAQLPARPRGDPSRRSRA